MNRDIIASYTEYEGGKWLPMPKRKSRIPGARLLADARHKARFTSDLAYCILNKMVLHSFLTNHEHRWDCINGWTR